MIVSPQQHETEKRPVADLEGVDDLNSLCDISSTPKSGFKFHLYSIYLFTRNDFKVILYPQTAVGVFQALAGSLLLASHDPSFYTVATRIPLIAFWNWYNLLTFNLANQRLPASVTEDALNKSWRPIPAGRMSPETARKLLFWMIPTGLLLSYLLGGFRETVAMLILTWMYNDLGGANDHYITRNIINALGFICHGSGSTLVAAGLPGTATLNSTAQIWLAIIGAVIFTTLQVQDLPDMEGDAARGRKTFPLVQGETTTRRTVAVGVFLWSFVCPTFWRFESVLGYLPLVAVGLCIIYRVLCYRTVASDEKTYQLWCVWLVLVYLLPLMRNPAAIVNIF